MCSWNFYAITSSMTCRVLLRVGLITWSQLLSLFSRFRSLAVPSRVFPGRLPFYFGIMHILRTFAPRLGKKESRRAASLIPSGIMNILKRQRHSGPKKTTHSRKAPQFFSKKKCTFLSGPFLSFLHFPLFSEKSVHSGVPFLAALQYSLWKSAHYLSFSFIFFHVLSFFFHFLLFCFVFFHFLACSFILFHVLSFSFIFFHFLSFTFIFIHLLLFTFIFFHTLSYSFMFF